ncbi:MAG: hypothetical protein WC315_07575 [Candidatus Omnitrophota bacterium]
MHVTKKNNIYSLFEGDVLIAEFNLQKFSRAYAYTNGSVKTPISLNNSIEVGFQLLGLTADWDAIRTEMLNPTAVSTPKIPLPSPPLWSEIVGIMPDYRRYAFEVVMCFMASNKRLENPPWLSIISPSSTGKSFILKLFDHPDVAMMIDDFTDNALASGTPDKDAAEVMSMLDDAEGINLVMNDMSSVFSQKPEKINKFIGSLTTAYGGTFVKYSPGTGAQRHNSATTIIMGMTNRTFKHHRNYMSMLGNRFLFLTLKRPEYIRHRQDKRLYDLNDIRLKTCAFQQKLIKMPDPEFPDDVDDYLYNFVHKTIVMRNIRWITSWNEMEGESRLYQELIELCKTRAKIYDRNVEKEDVDFFKYIAYETIPYMKNISQIYNVINEDCNNKWTKAMFLNAKKLGLLELIDSRKEIYMKGFFECEKTVNDYSWNEEYSEYIEDAMKSVLYSDDGGEVE